MLADVDHRVEDVPDGAGAVDHVGDPAGDQAEHRGHTFHRGTSPHFRGQRGEDPRVGSGAGATSPRVPAAVPPRGKPRRARKLPSPQPAPPPAPAEPAALAEFSQTNAWVSTARWTA